MRVYFSYNEREYSSDEELQEFCNEVIYRFFQNAKVRIIKSILPLKKQIDEYEGFIVVNDKSQIVISGFPEELSDRMFDLIKAEFD